MVKKLKIKHYFALDKKLSDEFIEYLKTNCIDKQKLLEKFVIQYLNDIKNNSKK